MKAALEHISPDFGTSFFARKFNDQSPNKPPTWHSHPDFEIVYLSTGSGKRHVGQSISYFKGGELIFLGPDIPHFGFSQDLSEDHVEVVVQMRPDFLGKDFWDSPEMAAIRQLFERARSGISFGKDVQKKVGALLEEMADQHGFRRLMSLLEALNLMANTDSFTNLQAEGVYLEVNPQDKDRMSAVNKLVRRHYKRQISLEEVAELTNMTVPAFCRYFKKLTNRTFTRFVNEFRVAHACKLLENTQMTIATIGLESGFNNLSHFNKKFLEITGHNPSAYRNELSSVLQG